MKIQNYRDVKGNAAAPGVTMKVVAGPDEGAPSFVMRVFEIEPGGATPHHAHAWEHEMFVIEGVHTTIPFHRRILDHPDFRASRIDTHFLERFEVPVLESAAAP